MGEKRVPRWGNVPSLSVGIPVPQCETSRGVVSEGDALATDFANDASCFVLALGYLRRVSFGTGYVFFFFFVFI